MQLITHQIKEPQPLSTENPVISLHTIGKGGEYLQIYGIIILFAIIDIEEDERV